MIENFPRSIHDLFAPPPYIETFLPTTTTHLRNHHFTTSIDYRSVTTQ
jgi:hypothetical protein